ncbi:MAG: hypothetical protein WAK31_09450 [Chthoniobacterales bacterium]
MTSRLVTVDLILTTSLRLRNWKLLPMTKEEWVFYANVREVLNGWAKQIETQGLAISLDTIAENAWQIYRKSKKKDSWDHFFEIGNQLIGRAREIEMQEVDRLTDLVNVPAREEIIKTLARGERITFKKAALELTVLTNPSDAQERLEKFLTWVRNSIARYPDSKAYQMLSDVIIARAPLTISAIKLFKTRRYFPSFDEVYYLGRAEKRRNT